ncbi:hypothetical protein DPMN_113742 [Dreissena polymorpha]|uniref:Uncharacterized protein n=2 Tax=Dreissena polymorpha TaxID=45954 RepID=A0A9D4KIT0_DREPO|nr:hypothetical protein DPMN_113742 [Dreissena polymorpha]
MLDTAVHHLKATVDKEVSYMMQLLEVIGQLDTLFSASQHVQSTNEMQASMSHDASDQITLQPSVAATEAS